MSKEIKDKKPKKQSKLQTKVVELEKQVADLTEDVKRAQADFVNFKRRAETDKQTSREYGQREIILQLLPVFDTLDRALASAPDDLVDHEWAKGISSAAKQLETQLAGLGLNKIADQGAEFDPEQHEAVSVSDGEGEKEVVQEVLQAGYKLNETVIRPAMVKVERK